MRFLSWKLITFVYIPVLIVAGIVTFSLTKEKEPPFQTAQAEIKDLIYEVEVTGTVKRAEEFELQFKNSGKISGVYVGVGDEVGEGKTLAKQQNTDLTGQIIEAKAALQLAQAQLAQAQDPYSPSQIQIARTEYENAVLNLQDVKQKAEIDLQQDLDSAQNYLAEAKSKIDKALLATVKDMRIDYFQSLDQVGSSIVAKENDALRSYLGDKTYNLLGAVDYYNQVVVNPTQSNILVAISKMVESAQKTRDTLVFIRDAANDGAYGVTTTEKTNLDTEITTMNTQISNLSGAGQAINSQQVTNQNNINSAQSTVKNKLNEWELKKAGAHQPDINVAQAKVTQAQATLTALQTKFRDTVISAPAAGIITDVTIKRGETATANEVIIKMIGFSENQIEVNVSEVDISSIKTGDEAEITLDAFPFGQSWQGRVVKIDPAQTIISDVVYYKVLVDFTQQDNRIKTGMTANIIIKTEKKEGVLAIPQRAVVEKNGQNFVRVPAQQNEYNEKEVTLGMRSSDGDVEILSGLNKGDSVITFIKNGN